MKSFCLYIKRKHVSQESVESNAISWTAVGEKIWSCDCFSHPLRGTLVIVHVSVLSNRVWKPLIGARDAGSEASALITAVVTRAIRRVTVIAGAVHNRPRWRQVSGGLEERPCGPIQPAVVNAELLFLLLMRFGEPSFVQLFGVDWHQGHKKGRGYDHCKDGATSLIGASLGRVCPKKCNVPDRLRAGVKHLISPFSALLSALM
jgi:hypothetical protein